MAIEHNNTPSAFAEAYNLTNSQTQTTNTSGGTKDKPKTEIWLNVGYTVMVKHVDENGIETIKEDFVSLPLGLSLDDQKPRDLSRITNVEYRQRMAAQNALLEMLQNGAKTLSPGEAKKVKLEIQMRRINEDQKAPAAETNPFVAPINNLFD